jgi:hypothetical protein
MNLSRRKMHIGVGTEYNLEKPRYLQTPCSYAKLVYCNLQVTCTYTYDIPIPKKASTQSHKTKVVRNKEQKTPKEAATIHALVHEGL